MPMRPLMPSGRPGLSLISVQVSPPSADLKMPLPGPPDSRIQGRRITCHSAAYRTRGLVGSMPRSIAPVWGLRYSTRSQLAPPSRERNTPRCSLGPKAWPSAAT